MLRLSILRYVLEPLKIGLCAAWTNKRPIVAFWGLAVLFVFAYYELPGVSSFLEPIALWHDRAGALSAFVSCSLFCGFLPYLVYRRRVAALRPKQLGLTIVAQSVWCGLCGIACDWFFGVQSRWFGSGHDLPTLLTKTVIDQFVWTVLVIAPANAIFYAVTSGRFGGKGGLGRVGDFVRTNYLPNIFMNWCVWIPAVFSVYVFPRALQVQVLGFVSASWVIICREIGARDA